MRGPKYFKTLSGGKYKYPLFFPDATRAVLRTVDSVDIVNTQTPGILVNTYHLYRDLGRKVIKKFGGVGELMSWSGATISDSGGFQVMSIVKKSGRKNSVTDEGVMFYPEKRKKILFTPEKSIRFQMELNTDLVVVLDDFTDPNDSHKDARESVERTILWAKRSKSEFLKICKEKNLKKDERPYLIGVVQGGEYLDLRENCIERLVEIGFDGLGYGGWPITNEGKFNYDVAKIIADLSPPNYLLYGLGVGKPEEIVALCNMGYHIFDCVLPTRDARHKRLYVYNFDSIDDIDVTEDKFYSYHVPDKEKYFSDSDPVSNACDCLLCENYSRAYLAHLFRIKELTALRLATIHNIRFYAILMDKIRSNFG